MALEPCPSCKTMVSPRAASCPSCGHPLAQLRAEATAKKKAAGARNTLLVAGGIIILVIFFAANVERTPAAGASKEVVSAAPKKCLDDWHLCRDNGDIAQNYRVGEGKMSVTILCKLEAERIARNGSPEWGWLTFTSYQSGSSALTSGKISLLERDILVPNTFGGKNKTNIYCDYDLRTDRVSIRYE